MPNIPRMGALGGFRLLKFTASTNQETIPPSNPTSDGSVPSMEKITYN